METRGIRLQRLLAQAGVASRRAAESLIVAGRVAVNGAVVTQLGTRVRVGADRVCVDGKPVGIQRHRTILLYKPRGYVCSASPRDGRIVLELLNGVAERLVPVGRLDKNSEGLLLLSNDGDLVQRLTHPRHEKEKEYRVTVSGPVSPQTLEHLRRPIELDGYRTRPAGVKLRGASAREGRNIVEFVLREGRKRQVRRLCEAAGLSVRRLVRTRIGPLRMGGMRPGQWRDLTDAEVTVLKGDAG
jgi:pseudouridine synthase